MSSRDREIAVELARAEAILADRARRHRSPLTFGSSRGVLAWYSRSRHARISSTSPSTVRRLIGFDRLGRPRYEQVRISVDGSRGVSAEDVRCALVDIDRALVDLAKIQPGRVRALLLTRLVGQPETAHHRRGRLLLTQVEAARVLNVNQATISRWVGWCESQLRPTFIAAGLILEPEI